MKVVQLLHRIARRARPSNGNVGGDLTAFSLTEQGDLMEAANAALQGAYGLLPAVYKEITQGFLLPAPATISAQVTANSKMLGTPIFTAAQVGRSVALDGDSNWNQVVDTDELLNPYLGSTGTVAGTVYGDAVFSDLYPFDRILGNPRFPNQGANLLFNPNLLLLNTGAPAWFYAQTIGMPLNWWTQPLGVSQGKTPLLVVKFSPAPDTNYTVDIRFAFWPMRLTQTNYDDNTAIPLPDQFLDMALVPLGLEALMSSPIWDGKGDPNVIIAAAERARNFLRMQVGQVAAPNNRILTPVGF